MSDFDENCRIVSEEYGRYEAALPELLKTHGGKWIVFRDNTVQGVFDAEEEAYNAGLAKYGLEGGFVIVEVKEPSPPEFLTASIAFGFFG